MSRFLSGERDITSERCDRLLAALGLIVVRRYRNAPKVPWTIRGAVVETAKAAALDYRALAVKAGLPAPTVHRYLHGRRDMTTKRCGALFRALDLMIVTPRQHDTYRYFRHQATGW